MIPIKTERQLAVMRKAGIILSEVMELLRQNARAGVTTLKLDSIAKKHIEDCGGKPSFLGMYGFPNSVCISINDELIHGIPSPNRRLEEGQIVSVDAGVFLDGLHVDAARTFIIGEVDQRVKKLVEVTEQSFFEAVKSLKAGSRVGDIGYEINRLAKQNGFTVVRSYTGHGVGKELHEEPVILNFGMKGSGSKLQAGMTLAIEPMLNMGKAAVYTAGDKWTVKTRDGLPCAHYENTVLITEGGHEILTLN